MTSLQVLSSEREKHAASETELNMKNLGLADKLKEARGEVTGMWHIFLIIFLIFPVGVKWKFRHGKIVDFTKASRVFICLIWVNQKYVTVQEFNQVIATLGYPS